MKLRHKINHGWTPPSSPLASEDISERYEGEITAAVHKAEKAHRRALKALESAEQRLMAAATQDAVQEARRSVERIRTEVERRFLELRDLELQMQHVPSTGANRSGRSSVRNPLPKGTKL